MRRLDFIAELGTASERNQMNAPRAPIVVTNYNYGRFVARCIDSALAQSYPDIEVVVVDDASRDHSREIIQSYGKRVVPVKFDDGDVVPILLRRGRYETVTSGNALRGPRCPPFPCVNARP
jgi:GT2 family glycosyltransferase